ncbi:MAG: hypothetical protein ACW99G_03250 [Candidatus Thorarchaeota archaeon]|jgi:hypothetical protein
MSTVLIADLNVAGDLIISSSDFDANGFNVTVTGNLTFSSVGILNAGEGTWTIGGNAIFSAGTVNEETSDWIIAGNVDHTGTTYSGGSGSITLNPTSGTSTVDFNDNFIGDLVVNASGATVDFTDGWFAADYLHNSGTVDYGGETFQSSDRWHISKPATVTGLAGTTWTIVGQLVINSQDLNPGSAWFIVVDGSDPQIGHSTIENLDASGGLSAIEAWNSTDSGSNTNVTFVGDIEGTGGAIMDGVADAEKHLTYIPTGGIVMTGKFNPPIIQAVYNIDLVTEWNVAGDISRDLTMQWDVGSTDLKWYRIEGKCVQPNCLNIGVAPGIDSELAATPAGALIAGGADPEDIVAVIEEPPAEEAVPPATNDITQYPSNPSFEFWETNVPYLTSNIVSGGFSEVIEKDTGKIILVPTTTSGSIEFTQDYPVQWTVGTESTAQGVNGDQYGWFIRRDTDDVVGGEYALRYDLHTDPNGISLNPQRLYNTRDGHATSELQISLFPSGSHIDFSFWAKASAENRFMYAYVQAASDADGFLLEHPYADYDSFLTGPYGYHIFQDPDDPTLARARNVVLTEDGLEYDASRNTQVSNSDGGTPNTEHEFFSPQVYSLTKDYALYSFRVLMPDAAPLRLTFSIWFKSQVASESVNSRGIRNRTFDPPDENTIERLYLDSINTIQIANPGNSTGSSQPNQPVTSVPTSGTSGSGSGSCDVKFLQYMAATSVAELCEQMKGSELTPPVQGSILSIQRYSRPVYSDSDLATGDDQCNVLIEEPFEDIPECIDFAVDESLSDDWGSFQSVVDVFLEYLPDGNSVLGSGIQLGGCADARVAPIIYEPTGGIITGGNAAASTTGSGSGVPSFFAEGSGGIITGGGIDADPQANWVYTVSGGIIMGGEIDQPVVVKELWLYEASGGIVTGGEVDANVFYVHVPVFPLIFTGGTADVAINAYSDNGAGGAVMGGSAEAFATPRVYVGSGGILMGGDAIENANPRIYDEQISGGIITGGTAGIERIWEGSGGAIMGGTADAQVNLAYNPDGNSASGAGIIMAGEARTITAIYKYEPDGGIIMGGEADTATSHLGLIPQEGDADQNFFGVFDEELLLEPQFLGTEGDELTIDDGTATTNCGCDPLSLTLILSHNLENANYLGSFLSRNGFVLPREFDISFRDNGDSWRENFHYRGLSDDGISLERWNLLFEWQCTNIIGGENLGQFRWKFCLQVQRKHLGTGEDSTTRLIYSIPSAAACSSTAVVSNTALDLNVTFNADTQTGVVITSTDVVSDPTIFFDGIGLFASPFWFENPNLVITLSTIEAPAEVERFDIQPIFPDQPLLLSP